MLNGYYYCLNCHSEITPDYNEHCTFCGSAAIAVDGDYSNEEVEKAFDLLEKEKQGLAIVLPCMFGETVYAVGTPCGGCPHYNELSNQEILKVCSNCTKMEIIECLFDSELLSEYGKTVFLTRKEAERKLEEKNYERL